MYNADVSFSISFILLQFGRQRLMTSNKDLHLFISDISHPSLKKKKPKKTQQHNAVNKAV